MPKQKKKISWKKLPGLSILLSVILISVIVVFSIGVTTMVIDNSRQAANVQQGTSAYYTAEAGLEQALWVNRALTNSPGGAVGANTYGSTGGALGDTKNPSNFKIQGLANSSLVSATASGVYIQPLPWTGNVPWHGEGSKLVFGGCDPQKPPTLSGSGAAKYFSYKGITDKEIEHPCNWGKLAVGEKVSIPLFGVGTGGTYNIDDFKIRVRMPCKDSDHEFCAAKDRMQLNCWDKGSNEKVCKAGFGSSNNIWRGEVMLLWQIKATKGDGTVATLNPLESTLNSAYNLWDSQLYEGKINTQQYPMATFDVVSTSSPAFPIGGIYTSPQGLDLETVTATSIKDFIDAYSKPVLTLSVVSSLVGCATPDNCDSIVDNPKKNSAYVAHMIPYLEYQVQLLNANSSNPPASKDNIISAEGQSGPFDQTIQVKAPTDNSTLEYVIQQ